MISSPEGALSLSALEDWLRLVVTTPGGLPAGLRRAHERYGAAQPIRVKAGADAGERLAIHARGYLERLLACLRADYPAVLALLGDALFQRFVTGYLGSRPPRHYSLFGLGEGFADHLEQTRPPDGVVPEHRRSLLRLPIDLARAERARLKRSARRGSRTRSARTSTSPVSSRFSGQSARRGCTVSADHRAGPRRARLPFGCRSRRGPSVPEARPSLLAVSRAAYRPVLTELAPWQRRALVCCGSPRPLVALAEEVAVASGEDRGAALADLLLWLPTAQGLGMVSVIRSSPRAQSLVARQLPR